MLVCVCACACACARVYVCVCMCVRARARLTVRPVASDISESLQATKTRLNDATIKLLEAGQDKNNRVAAAEQARVSLNVKKIYSFRLSVFLSKRHWSR